MLTLHRLFAHLEWADQKVLGLFRELPEIGDRPRQLFSHVLMAERIWMKRLRAEDPTELKVWPTLSLAELGQLANANHAAFRVFLEHIVETGGFDEIVAYQTFSGEPFEHRVADILTHVALHGAYHRGQIAAALRTDGQEVVDTDFIEYLKAGG